MGKVEVPTDAKLVVVVQRLDGADGKPLYPMVNFTKADADKLTALEAKYGSP